MDYFYASIIRSNPSSTTLSIIVTPPPGSFMKAIGRVVALNADGTVLAVGAAYTGTGGYTQVYQRSDGAWVKAGPQFRGKAVETIME